MTFYPYDICQCVLNFIGFPVVGPLFSLARPVTTHRLIEAQPVRYEGNYTTMGTQFTVGMQVARFRDHHDKEPKTTTVARVLKNQIVTADGDRWTLRGDAWGSGESWFRARIEPITPELQADLAEMKRVARRRRLRQAVIDFVAKDLSGDEIDLLYDYLRNKGMPEV